ncbi:PREDICTED: TMV resistance protein N-like [Lupinus angustifolius]|uniref:TMV resistance protein N-like n=1 Tax=Lupinus angustifolius TaxID=3871 RepID=UPI00092E54EC|nr:PREDICTED: TMV resistance protein N-like [Lupinus angustifolius]
MTSKGGSCQISQWKYHVFLSFRGGDTRKSFTDHLYAALNRKGILVFRDGEQLLRGEVISQQLLHAIQQSLTSVVVISPDYASSTWCLEELHNILESTRVLGRKAFPVFYGVDPSHVRYQSGNLAESFRKLEQRFSADLNKVQKWRNALRGVANLSGWDSRDRHETELIEDIVGEVWINLQQKLQSDNDGLVGNVSRIRELDSLLSIESLDVRFIGLWGMGGIGKTTLARVVFDKIRDNFEIPCFLHNVKEVSKTPDGLVCLQRKLLSPLKIRNLEIDDLYDGKKKIRNLLCNKKVLLVLDNISSLSQLESLAKNQEWFGLGSRVIVTTKDRHLLVSHGVCKNYEMEILNESDSFQLFSQKAFKSDKPPEHYLELTKSMLHYAGGLPLALEVLGSFLCERKLSEWEDALAKIKQVPPDEIWKTLRISYDELEDAEKTMFLDIAFFFAGQWEVEVIQILKDCGLHPTIGISLLSEKSLVTCQAGTLGMHDLLQEMGKKVVFQESPNDASRRSRLCSLEEVNQVLRKAKGTESTEGIIVKSSDPHEEHWDPEAFSKMYNLKVLIILCDLHLPLGLKCLSSSLKILEWESCSLRELPLGLPLDELVHLKMHCSKFNQLWSGTKHFRKLKSIDLTDSRDLIRTPDIFEVPCLERLVLKGCKNIVEVHQSVAQHKHLLELNLECCINLKTLPRKLEMDALKELILSGCSQVKKLPEFGKSMVYLSILSLKDCKSLICLPQSIRNLKSLIKLDIQGCSKLFGLPNNLNENNVVEEVEVNETTRREAPLSLSDFKALVTLLSKGCDWLSSKSWSISLPADEVFGCKQYPLSMDLKFSPLLGCSMLKSLNLAYCNLSDGSIPNDIGQLSALEKLILNGNNFAHLPACIQKLHRLKWLELNDCPRLGTLPLLPPAVTCLTLQNCTQLAPISFDSRRIWNILDARRRELKYGLWFMVPGSEIPPWFENEDYVLAEANLLDPDYGEKYDFLASKLVDIHNHYSCPCAGIALCLSLESPMIFSHKCLESITVDWSLKDPPKFHPLQPGTGFRTYFKGRHLLIKILRRGGVFMPYAWGDKKVELKITGKNLCGCRKLKLRGFGSRVIYEDDQWWQRDEEADEDEINVSSVSVQYGINLKQSRIAEIIDNLECDELRRKHVRILYFLLCFFSSFKKLPNP